MAHTQYTDDLIASLLTKTHDLARRNGKLRGHVGATIRDIDELMTAAHPSTFRLLRIMRQRLQAAIDEDKKMDVAA